MTDSVTMPFELRLVVPDRGTYDVAACRATFATGGVNSCSVVINVGKSESGAVVSVGFQRGDRAYIDVSNASILATTENNVFGSLIASGFRLFDGVIDDFGPVNLSFGVFQFQVQVFGRLAWLNSGTLSASSVKPNHYTDRRVELGTEFGAYFSKFQIRYPAARTDLRSALTETFYRISTDAERPGGSISEALVEYFNLADNTETAEVIAAITGTLAWRNIVNNEGVPVTTQVVDSIVSRLNEYLINDWYMESYLAKLINIGKMLRCELVETGLGIKFVPWIPFYRSADAYPILPQTVASVQWVVNEFSNYQGCALMGGPGSPDSPQELIIGGYKRPGKPFGFVHVAEAPSILYRENYIGDLFNLDIGQNWRVSRTDIGDIGDRFAKIMTWELNYGKRVLQVTCPMFRTDIGPLTAVRVDMPATPDINWAVATPAMYGSVQSVTIYLDATAQQASTTYQVGWVRSYQQQDAEIDPDIVAGEHPFFVGNDIGGRLDSSERRPVSVVGTEGNFGGLVGTFTS